MRQTKISKEIVFGLLSYDKNSGDFTWLVRRNAVRAPAGGRAGTTHTSRNKSYIVIIINGKQYKAHHLAWLFHYGEWPDSDLDHRDGDGTNNRITNLRPCNMSENKANSKRYKNNKSGFKGVFWDKKEQRFVVSIQWEKKRRKIGRFKTLEEAASAYKRAAEGLFGDFARPE